MPAFTCGNRLSLGQCRGVGKLRSVAELRVDVEAAAMADDGISTDVNRAAPEVSVVCFVGKKVRFAADDRAGTDA